MAKLCVPWLLIFLCACENEVSITAPGNPLPVAYCLLDPADSTQRLLISQAYNLKQTGQEINPDSLLINPECRAIIERSENGHSGGICVLNFREESFRQTDIARYIRISLEAECRILTGSGYSLHVFDKEGKEIFSGETNVIGPLKLLDPMPVPGRELTLSAAQGYLIRWAPALNAGVYQTVIYFNYLESGSFGIDSLQLRIPLRINISYEQVHPISQQMSGVHFFDAVRNGIEYKPGIRRKAAGLDFELIAGGEEFAIYVGQEVNGMNDFGRLEYYSNFDRAKGFFSSRSSVWARDIKLSNMTHDSLAASEFTRHLGFVFSGEEL